MSRSYVPSRLSPVSVLAAALMLSAVASAATSSHGDTWLASAATAELLGNDQLPSDLATFPFAPVDRSVHGYPAGPVLDAGAAWPTAAVARTVRGYQVPPR